MPWLLKADIMQVAETSWPLYVYAKRQFSMGPRIRPKETHNLTGRRPVMTLTSCAGDNEEYYGYCPREPCACALAKLVKSTYALMERSPPEDGLSGPVLDIPQQLNSTDKTGQSV